MKLTIYDESEEAQEAIARSDSAICRIITISSNRPIEVSTGDKEVWLTVTSDQGHKYSFEIHPHSSYPNADDADKEFMNKASGKEDCPFAESQVAVHVLCRQCRHRTTCSYCKEAFDEESSKSNG